MSDNGFKMRMPSEEGYLNQDEEYFFIEQDGEWRKIRFHDYDEIYKIPGLYEHLFYERLKCNSPKVIAGLLEEELNATPNDMEDLNVLDLGAGNGLVGKVLYEKGVNTIVGVDIIEEAAEAVMRDNPGVYDDYLVEDFCDIDDSLEEELGEQNFNCLTCVAALGFNDIPPDAFSTGYNLLDEGGMVAFNIKPDFMEEKDSTGFSCLIKETIGEGVFELRSAKSYQHRLSAKGESIDYVAMVGTKLADIPQGLCAESIQQRAVDRS